MDDRNMQEEQRQEPWRSLDEKNKGKGKENECPDGVGKEKLPARTLQKRSPLQPLEVSRREMEAFEAQRQKELCTFSTKVLRNMR